jgi:TolB-like protein
MGLVSELRRRNVFRMAVLYSVAAWLVMQVVEVMMSVVGLPGWAGRATFAVLAVGFPIALIFSWFYEITPEGISLEKDVDPAKSITNVTGRRLDFIVISLLCAAVILFAYDKWWIGAPPEKSIAVLPFENMSADPEQEFFSDGISEELLNLLAQIPELRVISRSSAFVFKGEKISIPEVAKKLNVAHVLEGSVRKAGNQVRITVQLIDARSDTHLWSETYDRELDNIFAIQDEISADVVEQLKITILGDPPQATKINSEAYGLYLRGREIVHSGQWDKLPLAEQLLNEALQIEPDYVPALNALSLVYYTYRDEHWASPDHFEQVIRGLAARISTAKPGSGEDFGWQAWIARQFDNDLSRAAELYERAFAIDPDDLDGLRTIVPFLREIGYIEEAIATAEYIVLRDPVCVYCLQILSTTYREVGKYERAIELLEDAIAWSPDRDLIYWALGSVLLQAGRPEDALAAFEKEHIHDQRKFGRIFALHDLGRLHEFEEEFEQFRLEKPDNYEGIARIYAWIGENDLAFENLEKLAAARGPEALKDINIGGFYKKLKLDPRFDELLRKHGQHPDQQKRIDFKFTPPE